MNVGAALSDLEIAGSDPAVLEVIRFAARSPESRELERLRNIEKAVQELVGIIPATYTEATDQQLWERAYVLRAALDLKEAPPE
jgi:hypothetical protein